MYMVCYCAINCFYYVMLHPNSPLHITATTCGVWNLGANVRVADKYLSKLLVWSTNLGHLNIVAGFVLSCLMKNRERYKTTC
jgi:hypothetical protein